MCVRVDVLIPQYTSRDQTLTSAVSPRLLLCLRRGSLVLCCTLTSFRVFILLSLLPIVQQDCWNYRRRLPCHVDVASASPPELSPQSASMVVPVQLSYLCPLFSSASLCFPHFPCSPLLQSFLPTPFCSPCSLGLPLSIVLGLVYTDNSKMRKDHITDNIN